MGLFHKKGSLEEERMVQLEKENLELKNDIKRLEIRLEGLMLDLMEKNLDAFEIERRRNLLERDMREFKLMKKDHEIEFEEFQKRYNEFRKQNRELEKNRSINK